MKQPKIKTHNYPDLGLLALGHQGLDLLKGNPQKKIDQSISGKRKTLLIGWDALDWKLVNQFRAKGIMPTLDRLIKTGVSGKIATLDPPFSPMLWTSVATGKTADKHGILGFFERYGESARPVHASARTARTLWNIFTHENINSNVINWWPSHPVEQIQGNMVSDLAFKSIKKQKKSDPLQFPAGSAYPFSNVEELSNYALRPSELSQDQILPFLPDATNELLKSERKGVGNLMKILSKCASVHAMSTRLMTTSDWQFTAIYHDAVDHACHGFMKFFPPKLEGIPEEKFKLFHYVVEGIYRFHDMMLETLLALAGENTDVILLSDHGFHSDHLRPTRLPKMDAGPALEHAPFGVLVMNGPSFKQGETVTSASLLDITPTLLHLNNLPVGEDMNGRVLAQAFQESKSIQTIPSWEQVPGNFGEERVESTKAEEDVDDETLVQLVELGYINADAKNLKGLEHKAEIHQMYNLARVYINKNEMARAIFILNELFKKDPEDIRYNISLITCYLAIDQHEEARKVLDHFKSINKNPVANMALLEARMLRGEKNYPLALNVLKNAALHFKHNLSIHLETGFTLIKISKFSGAITAFDEALKLDHENSRALVGKALAYLRLERIEESIQCALDAIDLMYANPKAHSILGEAFEAAMLHTEATQAYENALAMAPNLKGIRTKLVHLYKNELNQPELAKKHQSALDTPLSELILVSGLPRSGTSMMMQLLEAGGVPLLTDHKREADQSNPKGYYEYEPVKKLMDDVAWLPKADGKAIKIVAPLLRYLPQNFQYKVIFMKRDLNQVIRSQQKMLGKDPETIPLGLYNSYQSELKNLSLWQKLQPHAEVLELEYADVVENPEAVFPQIAAFLGKPLRTEDMLHVVNPELYRNR